MATEDEFNDAKNDTMVALLKNVERLANLESKSAVTYDSMMKAALAFRHIAGGEQPG